MGDRDIGNLRLLNGLAIEAYPALFPCKIRSVSATAWAWLKTRVCEESRPLARTQRKASSSRKRLSSQSLAAAVAKGFRKRGGEPATVIHLTIKFVICLKVL